MAKQTTERPDLVAVLRGATAEDKSRIDARIDELTKELESLRIVQKLLDVKLNGKAPRKTPQRKPAVAGTTRAAPGGGKTAKERVYDYLAAQGRPCKPALIAQDIGLNVTHVYQVLQDTWFEKTEDGYKIAKAA